MFWYTPCSQVIVADQPGDGNLYNSSIFPIFKNEDEKTQDGGHI